MLSYRKKTKLHLSLFLVSLRHVPTAQYKRIAVFDFFSLLVRTFFIHIYNQIIDKLQAMMKRSSEIFNNTIITHYEFIHELIA